MFVSVHKGVLLVPGHGRHVSQFKFARLVELTKQFQFVVLSIQCDVAPLNQRLLLKIVKLVLDRNSSIALGDTTTGRIRVLPFLCIAHILNIITQRAFKLSDVISN